MKVPDGMTLYYGKKRLKAGDEIPKALESKFAKTLDRKNKSKPQVFETKEAKK
jgi:hypothetical protein